MKNPFKQELTPKLILNKIPALYAQDGKGDDAIAYVKYFAGGHTWYGTEYDPVECRMFGKVFTSQCPEGELGYWDMNELAALRVRAFVVVERDIHFKPTPLKNCHNDCVAKAS